MSACSLCGRPSSPPRVATSVYLLEEQVHFVVGPRDHLGGLRSASLVAGGDLLLGGGVDEVGLVLGGQVGQL